MSTPLHNNSQPARAGVVVIVTGLVHERRLSIGLRLWYRGSEALRHETEAETVCLLTVFPLDTVSVPHKKSKVNSLQQSFLNNLLTITELRLLCKVQRFNGVLYESVAGGHNYGDFVSDYIYLSATDGIFGLVDPAMEGILLEYGVESLSGSRYEVQMLEMCMYFIYLCTISRRVPAPPIRNSVFLLLKCNMVLHLLLLSYPLMEMSSSPFLYTLSSIYSLSYLIAIIFLFLRLCETKGISILRGFLIDIHDVFHGISVL